MARSANFGSKSYGHYYGKAEDMPVFLQSIPTCVLMALEELQWDQVVCPDISNRFYKKNLK